jgi:hypothetical protein
MTKRLMAPCLVCMLKEHVHAPLVVALIASALAQPSELVV